MRLRRPEGGIIDLTGVKRLHAPNEGEVKLLTPYGRKALSRRRAARKVAHESRRRNRAR